jgi:MoCo/4Fe-4S cofactor protein with predicted Tat translocation signal
MSSRKDLSRELGEFQKRLGSATGKRYWRTLEELADTEAFQELMRLEFPEQSDIWPNSLSRRKFLTLMGASLALAGISGCSVRPAPSVNMAPYVREPEQLIPGRPLFFATAMTLGGTAVGLLVENHMGRPTKIEGNPDHPASLGATDLFHQASILTLYDPDRSKTVTQLGKTRTWDDATTALRAAMAPERKRRGAGLRILTETVVSPTLATQLEGLLKEFPEARWHQHEPLSRDAARAAARAAFGQPLNTYYDFTKADIVLSFDADFLTCGPGNLRYVADFMSRRRVRTTAQDAHQADMNRLYMVETTVSSTGAKADHRLALRAHEIEAFARAITTRMGIDQSGGSALGQDKWIDAVKNDLDKHRGRCVVLAGERQPAAVHLLAHALNDRLGNVGPNRPVLHTDPIEARPEDHLHSLQDLVHDIEQDRVEVLLILGGNPAFTAPADLHFGELLARKEKLLRFHLSLYQDETSRLCQWHLPEAHYLEAWGDARAFDGTASIVQPLIEPLYHGRSAHEILSVLANQQEIAGFEIVRGYWRRHWQQQGNKVPFEEFWQTALNDGVVAGTRLPTRSVPLRSNWQSALGNPNADQGGDQVLEINFQADPTIYDGCFANNGWLQELPKPITKLTWDNAALMSPATANELGVGLRGYEHGGEHGGYRVDVVELTLPGRPTVEAPVWIMPGHADHAITVYLGYGREYAGKVGGERDNKVGFNTYLLRNSTQLWFERGLQVRKTGRVYPLACTQQHQLMEQRDTVRAARLDEYREHARFAGAHEREKEHEESRVARKPLTLYEPFNYDAPKNKWGMVIDLTTCVGCKACVVACQAENNIPVVGKEQVLAGREMHWLRIDRYNASSKEDPQEAYNHPEEFYFQPLPCMHCEQAPCEYVCPTEATMHSADGLNDMIYQRCVGTRFCQNNCPYKVRRFNFFFYSDYDTPTRRLQYNPDVTVRSRGVMEKCSYCVQRIRHAQINAQVEHRPIADGEVLTACQAACPAQAIMFGDLNDPNSTVKKWKESPLHYGLLEDLNTAPRTTYLAALRNPNPDLEPKPKLPPSPPRPE